jgi:hypothetical protein
MDPTQRGHLAYLLRLWRADNGTEAIWRASLQDVRTGERLGFAGLDEALVFLRQQVEPPSDPRHHDCGPDSAAH